MSFSSFLFSILSDRIPFRYLVSILYLCYSINEILFYFLLDNPNYYRITFLEMDFL